MESIQELILVLILESELSIPVDSGIDTGIEVFWTSLHVINPGPIYSVTHLLLLLADHCLDCVDELSNMSIVCNDVCHLQRL